KSVKTQRLCQTACGVHRKHNGAVPLLCELNGKGGGQGGFPNPSGAPNEKETLIVDSIYHRASNSCAISSMSGLPTGGKRSMRRMCMPMALASANVSLSSSKLQRCCSKHARTSGATASHTLAGGSSSSGVHWLKCKYPK